MLMFAVLAASLARAEDRKKKDDPGQIGNRDVGKCLNFYSLDKELALGKQLAEEVQRQAKLNEDPMLGEFVNRVGQNLVRNSDAKLPFTFRVIEGESPNAFALPGGFVFVYTGLIKIATEEDEFAGAMAHEIAHVAARHMTCHATKSQLANLMTLPLGAVLGGWGGYAARQGLSFGVPAALMSFSRADESEADYLGVQYMYAAGYDPNGAVTIFEKLEALQRSKPGVFARIYGTHPMDATRIEKTQQEIQRILPAKPEYVVSTSEYHDMRERLIGLENRRKSQENDRKPKLRVAPGAGKPDGETEEDRPTIRRRDLVD
jgi:predicted Zn-dependent protease